MRVLGVLSVPLSTSLWAQVTALTGAATIGSVGRDESKLAEGDEGESDRLLRIAHESEFSGGEGVCVSLCGVTA